MALASVILVIWSFSLQWQFPSFMPVSWTTRFWTGGVSASFNPVVTTLATGVFATFISLVLAVGCMEHEDLSSRNKRLVLPVSLLYIPLLLPQVSFMAGVQLLLVFSNLDGFWISLVWSHILFILPYIFITLGATYRDFDHRITRQAIVLGKSYYKSLFKIKLPMLLRPILISAAIGFSVSVALYVPTIIVGSGRFFTVTTEVVTLATGSDRRAMAVFALIQQILPLVVYALAILVPKALYYNKKGMQT
jgi:putative thiamine transport system permease protein